MRVAKTATITTVSQPGIRSLQIPLPPLAEQKRIAGILDAADALRAKRRESLAQLDTLLQSTFLDMFGDPVTNPMGWEELADARTSGWIRCALGDQVTLQRGKDITKKAARPGDVPVISSGGVSYFHDEPFVTGPGVLLGRKGSVGKVHYTAVDFWPHDTTLYVKDFKGNVPRYVYYFFRHFPISHYEASAANPSLNRNNLHPVEVLWPPLDLQRRFAAIVESVERQKASQRAHLDELDTLFASLQSRAFRGDL
jgi:type I restriction enzyme S subunit